jgi:hypothetical protein
MYKGNLVIGQRGRDEESQEFKLHPKDEDLLVGQEDGLIYQLTPCLPEEVICAYELEGNGGMFANYAEGGLYKE